ncbi:hypothetical protein CR513_50458, partial [Mucuna pruriens]
MEVETNIFIRRRKAGLSNKSFKSWFMLNITKLFKNAMSVVIIDPITLNDIDDNNEWIVGELDGDGEDVEDELVYVNDVLTWRDVASAIGVAETLMYTRRQTQMQRAAATSTSRKENVKGVVEEEDEDESSEDEGEEEYNSSSNGGDEDNDMKLQEDDEYY